MITSTLLLTLATLAGCGAIGGETAALSEIVRSIGRSPAALTPRDRARIDAARVDATRFLNEVQHDDHPAGLALLDRHGLALLTVHDRAGNTTRRLRHPRLISADDARRVIDHLRTRHRLAGEHINPRMIRGLAGARPEVALVTHSFTIGDGTSPSIATFGYLPDGVGPAVAAGPSFLQMLRNLFDQHGLILLALAMIGGGTIVLALAWLKKPPPETAWHDSTRPAGDEPEPGPMPTATTHDDFHAEITKTVRIRSADKIHAALEARFGAQPEEAGVVLPEPPRATASERLEPELKQEVYENVEFQQERWNLPGFQSVYNPIQKSISARDIDFTAGGFGSMPEGDFLFAARYYKFAEAAENGLLTDIEGFARKFLDEITERFGPVETVLYLKNHKDRYHPVLSKKNTTFISGPAVQARHRSLDPLLLRQLQEGNCVVSEDGLRVYMPLSAREGMMGIVVLRGDRPLYRSKELSALWYEIKKYGEYLHQAKIYEQATTDPYSTLFNGLQFQHDLWNDFTMKKEVRYSRSLVIVQFCGRSRLDDMRLLGLGLRTAFARPFRLYRIAEDAAAILGPVMTAEEMEERFREFLNFVRAQNAVDISVGCALLDDDVTNPEEWFRRATRALEDSKKVGLNHFRTYRLPADAGKFSLRRD